jgi:uncharacterized membrane protein SirB2
MNFFNRKIFPFVYDHCILISCKAILVIQQNITNQGKSSILILHTDLLTLRPVLQYIAFNKTKGLVIHTMYVKRKHFFIVAREVILYSKGDVAEPCL